MSLNLGLPSGKGVWSVAIAKKKDFAVELVLNCVLDKRMPCHGDRNLEVNLLSVTLEIWSRYMVSSKWILVPHSSHKSGLINSSSLPRY